MLKLTGSPSPGHLRVIDDQTGAVVLNAVSAHFSQEAGSPPRLLVEVQGALIDAHAMVGGELCRIVGDGHTTQVFAPDGHPLDGVGTVRVEADAASGSAIGTVTLAEPPDEPKAQPSAPPEEPPAPIEAIPAGPTDAASEGGNTSEPSSNVDAEPAPEPTPTEEALQAPRVRRPRG